jgi:hypothetical protein
LLRKQNRRDQQLNSEQEDQRLRAYRGKHAADREATAARAL